MIDTRPDSCEPTAVDDVRRVRDRIAHEHGGDLRKHVEETNRIAEQIRAKLKVKIVPAPPPKPKVAGVGG